MKKLTLVLLSLCAISNFIAAANLFDTTDAQAVELTENQAEQASNGKTFWQQLRETFGIQDDNTKKDELLKDETLNDKTQETFNQSSFNKENQYGETGAYGEEKQASLNNDWWQETKKGTQKAWDKIKETFTGDRARTAQSEQV